MWIPLEKLRVKKGRWRHSVRFSEVHAAHEWSMSPSEFWNCSEQDQAFMIQYCNTVRQMESWEHEQIVKDNR